MATTILVTGATGTIGKKVVERLASTAGVTVRAAVRSTEKAPAFPGANVVPTIVDHDRPESYEAALSGVDRLFLLTPFAQESAAYGKRLVDVAKAKGVKRIVKQSAFGAEMEPGIQLGREHREVEKHIEASGIAYTFLRPNNFFKNFLGYYPPQKDGNIYLPWGTSACSFIAAGDIAEVAAIALTAPGHEGKAYTLTGPEAITVAQAAHAIGEVTGRKIAYVDVPEAAARKSMLDYGMSTWMVDGMMELHAIDKAGYAAVVTDAFPTVTGHKATTFLEFARKNAAAWK